MPLPQINNLLDACSGVNPPFPPTDLYQEKWLLRIVLHWFANHRDVPSPLQFYDERARWFSEAFLPSAFLARPGFRRQDPLAENWTHADGVVGHFGVGIRGKSDLDLLRDSKQLKVLEAKIFSPLKPGVTKKPYYDQAARNVACIAEVLKRAPRSPAELDSLAFYVLAPQTQIESGVFDDKMKRDSIYRKVEKRVGEYAGERDSWFTEWFVPTLDRLAPELKCISWEELIETITSADSASGEQIQSFYDLCRRFNGPRVDEKVAP